MTETISVIIFGMTMFGFGYWSAHARWRWQWYKREFKRREAEDALRGPTSS